MPKMSVLWFFQSRVTNAIAGAILVIVFAVFMFVAWQKWTAQSHPDDYEGRVVDRWVEPSGATEDYKPRPLLLIEANDGKRFTVKVDPNVYESARIGMRIRNRAGQLVLIDPNRDAIRK